MSLPSWNIETPAHNSNVRLVGVDDRHQPTYLSKALDLELALGAAAAKLGIELSDMPGLHGLCVAAVSSAERLDR